MKSIGYVLGILAGICASDVAMAQNAIPQCCMAGSRSGMTFLSNIDSAIVFVDARRVGLTPVTIDTLAPGKHVVRLVHPDISNWLTHDISDTIVVVTGEERSLRYAFDPNYVITSTPFGADVLLGDSLLGTTPLQLDSGLLPASHHASDSSPLLTIRKHGYEPAGVGLLNAQRGGLSVDLQRKWENAPETETIFKYEERNGSNHLPLYISGAATVISGVAAAYFKTRADDRYALYGGTGDPALLTETQHLDTASAVALVVTQVSFALFTYFILSE